MWGMVGETFKVIRIEEVEVIKTNWFVVPVFAYYNKYFLFSDW